MTKTVEWSEIVRVFYESVVWSVLEQLYSDTPASHRKPTDWDVLLLQARDYDSTVASVTLRSAPPALTLSTGTIRLTVSTPP